MAGLQLARFMPRAGVRLLEMLADAVADEEADVGLEDVEVGEGGDVVREVDRVIPEIEVAADPAPVLDVADERSARRIVGDGAAAVELDRAEHDLDVRGRPGQARRRAGILIGQGRDGLVGEEGGHPVDEAEDGARGRALLFDDLEAIGAPAIGEVVVLADRPDLLLRLRGDLLAQPGRGDVEDLGPGEAGLVDDPLAVHQGEILGMGFEVGLPRDEFLEGVDVIARAVEVCVELEPHPVEIVGVEGKVAVDDADRVDRIMGFEEAAEDEVVAGREELGRGAELPATEVLLEQMHDAVDDTLSASAGDVEVPGGGGQDEAVLSELRDGGRDDRRKLDPGETDDGRPGLVGDLDREDGEVDAAHLQDGRPQDLGRPPLDVSGADGDLDPRRRPAVVDEDEGPPALADLDGPLARAGGVSRSAGGRGEEGGDDESRREAGRSPGLHHPAL